MPRQREIMIGSRDQFAMKIAFLPDPDQGSAATVEHSLSWGGLEVWANGHNICRHIEQGESVDAVHWYLLPMLRWLASNWDFLLHEERLPARNAARDAWISMQRTAEAPPAFLDEAAEQWERSWHNWWTRHSILASREGGLLPNLFIRRWRDLIELSWGARPIAGAPGGFRFDAVHGNARFPCGNVADVLYEVLDAASRHLVNELPESATYVQLRSDVDRLKSTDSRRRMGLLSGFRSDELSPEDRWIQIKRLFPADLSSEVSEAVFGVHATPLVIERSPQVALMFGSLSPSIDDGDARLLAKKLVEFYCPGGESSELRRIVEDVPVEGSEEQAWRQGYQLAENCREALGAEVDRAIPVPIETILEQLGISVESIQLHDASVRAVALAGPNHKPAVLVNTGFQYPYASSRRFTLAHELCHILHDRNYGASLALASGPWAPVDVEKRANAFAAMFLMPTELVASVVSALTTPLNHSSTIWKVATAFETSFSATMEHLYKLGHIDA